jgi:hypothetical protein
MTSPLICWRSEPLAGAILEGANWCQQGNLQQRKLGVVINLAVRAAQSLQKSMDHEPRTQEPPASKFRRWHSALERARGHRRQAASRDRHVHH